MANKKQLFSLETVANSLLVAQSSGQCGTCLAVTSSGPREGKSTICQNIANVLSQKGRRVLLIDANPYHSLPDSVITENTPTLFDLLANPTASGDLTSLEDIEFPTIATGSEGDLIVEAPKALASLIEELDKHFDHVIFDLPAYESVRVTGIMISIIKDTLLVVKHQGPSNLVIKDTCEGIAQDGGNLLGTVFNRYKSYIPKFIDDLF
ncbi:MAG: tyrosine-protein kinase family protein [Opitutales bacterium]